MPVSTLRNAALPPAITNTPWTSSLRAFSSAGVSLVAAIAPAPVLGFVAQGADHLVAAGNDLVAVFEAGEDFDVGRAGDAGFHFAECGLAAGDHEHALDQIG